jgi:tripartite-type tricarboxylate transporter receptor subunit TctC
MSTCRTDTKASFEFLAGIEPVLLEQGERAMNRSSRFSTKGASFLLQIGLVFAGALAPHQAAAQQPGRVITIIVPQTPGTGPDILARIIGPELQSRLGQPVIVDNRSGASGNIGAHAAARAEPDGNTLMMHTTPLVTNAFLFKNLPYDPRTSFTPIIEIADGSIALTVHPSVPASSAQEFLQYVREHPGQINYGSPGIGTPHHLAMELLKFKTQTNLMHVPYKGTAGAVSDLMGGHISAMFLPTHVALPLAQESQIRLLAIASNKRVAVAPDVPTLAEQGIPGVEFDLWYGLFAPAGARPEIVRRLNVAVNEILRSPHVVDLLGKQGLAVEGGSPERLRVSVENELEKWPRVLQEAGIQAE